MCTAGQFETYLFQRGLDQVFAAIKRCWCSCFSERVMSHRLECEMSTTGLAMAVVVQVSVVWSPTTHDTYIRDKVSHVFR